MFHTEFGRVVDAFAKSIGSIALGAPCLAPCMQNGSFTINQRIRMERATARPKRRFPQPEAAFPSTGNAPNTQVCTGFKSNTLLLCNLQELKNELAVISTAVGRSPREHRSPMLATPPTSSRSKYFICQGSTANFMF